MTPPTVRGRPRSRGPSGLRRYRPGACGGTSALAVAKRLRWPRLLPVCRPAGPVVSALWPGEPGRPSGAPEGAVPACAGAGGQAPLETAPLPGSAVAVSRHQEQAQQGVKTHSCPSVASATSGRQSAESSALGREPASRAPSRGRVGLPPRSFSVSGGAGTRETPVPLTRTEAAPTPPGASDVAPVFVSCQFGPVTVTSRLEPRLTFRAVGLGCGPV